MFDHQDLKGCLMLSIQLRNFDRILVNLLKGGQAKNDMLELENMKEVKPIDIAQQQEKSFQSSSSCSICNKEFE